jgi:hypothetical protein
LKTTFGDEDSGGQLLQFGVLRMVFEGGGSDLVGVVEWLLDLLPMRITEYPGFLDLRVLLGISLSRQHPLV